MTKPAGVFLGQNEAGKLLEEQIDSVLAHHDNKWGSWRIGTWVFIDTYLSSSFVLAMGIQTNKPGALPPIFVTEAAWYENGTGPCCRTHEDWALDIRQLCEEHGRDVVAAVILEVDEGKEA